MLEDLGVELSGFALVIDRAQDLRPTSRSDHLLCHPNNLDCAAPQYLCHIGHQDCHIVNIAAERQLRPEVSWGREEATQEKADLFQYSMRAEHLRRVKSPHCPDHPLHYLVSMPS